MLPESAAIEPLAREPTASESKAPEPYVSESRFKDNSANDIE